MFNTTKLIITGVVGIALLAGVLVVANLNESTEPKQNDTAQEMQTAMEEDQTTQTSQQDSGISEPEMEEDSSENQSSMADEENIQEAVNTSSPEGWAGEIVITPRYTQSFRKEVFESPENIECGVDGVVTYVLIEHPSYPELIISNRNLISTDNEGFQSVKKVFSALNNNENKLEIKGDMYTMFTNFCSLNAPLEEAEVRSITIQPVSISGINEAVVVSEVGKGKIILGREGENYLWIQDREAAIDDGNVQDYLELFSF